MHEKIIFAIPKGRIMDEALPFMKAAGLMPEAAFFDKENRALMFHTENPQVDIIRVRAFDVATFVAHNAAQIGIVGSDVLDEFDYSDIYSPVDLGIGKCRLSLACPKEMAGTFNGNFNGAGHVRVATKYPHLTAQYFADRAIQAESIKLNGAMELAPLLNLAPYIVDLVSSGQTLKENGLVEIDPIINVSARLIVNRAAMKMQSNIVVDLVDKFREFVK
ncbi:ATP phosphoribosyltransferase [Sphingorhabdus lutea]|uniref:ATP phosphoribosyltransferase n=1 Tax=Sphingorhabdus lutea TaxID=1913578 RepID=A0A1L3JDE7_9SPHN|nr:ATP phosphoribosyltransferase [Sphingorhabdus lutea]APG63150.1 ATP phosphoribosyltransferase [Sphingorhabdus lutea]